MLKKLWPLLKTHFISSFQEQQGQGFVILAASFVGLVAMLGLSIDLGMVYIERVRVNNTVDAAVLASASELPFEEEAINRAIEYLKQNGYDVGNDVEILVRGCVTSRGGNIDETHANGVPQLAMQPVDEVKGALYIPAANTPARVTFMIDTGSFRGLSGAENTNDKPANLCQASTKDYGSSARIKVMGRSNVDMNFMKLLGFDIVPVYSSAVAQSINSLDIMLVFDASASMEFDTACVDCWVKTRAWVSDGDSKNYPYPNGNGYFNPIPYDPKLAPGKGSIPDSELCKPIDTYQTIDGSTKKTVTISGTVAYVIPSYVVDTSGQDYYYSVHEAELYSRNSPEDAWNLSQTTQGRGFWAIQRGSMSEAEYQYNRYGTVLDINIYNQGAHRNQYFYQSNQAGNPAQQSANVCHMGTYDNGKLIPGVQSASGDAVIDCTLGNPLMNGRQICELTPFQLQPLVISNSLVYPTDCSAYIQAKPFVSYDSMKDTGIVGGTYDSNCFPLNAGNKCWADSEFPSDPPYVEYDFTNRPDWGDKTAIWVRVIGGGDLAYAWNGSPNPVAGVDANGNGPGDREWWRSTLFWEVGVYDGDTFQSLELDNLPEENTQAPKAFHKKTSPQLRYPYVRDSRAYNSDWTWVILTDNISVEEDPAATVTGTSKQYTLRIYQGSAGYKIDRILFTNDVNGTHIQTVLNQNGGRGPQISRGSATRESCNKCNPAYGNEVTRQECSCQKNAVNSEAGTGCTFVPSGQSINQLNNDLYAGLQPFRSAQEAVKRFVQKLDPKFDQVGFIAFSNDVDTHESVRAKLQCRNYTANGNEGYNSGNCFTSNAITYTKVLRAIENQWPLNGTNTAAGLREGLEELGVSTPSNPADNECSATADDGHSCSRGDSARKIIILITDGIPTERPGTSDFGSPPVKGPNVCTSGVTGQKIWQGSPDNDYYQCAMFYAYQAAQANVAIYTIGLGGSADPYLLTAIATGSYIDANGLRIDSKPAFKGLGKFYPAASPLELDSIFDDILSQIYIDIVG